MASPSGGSWFAGLFGAEEAASYEETRALFLLEHEDGKEVLVAPNGRRFRPGRFEAPSLAELRARLGGASGGGALVVENTLGDVRGMHVQPQAAGAVFQVASQCNCLEFKRADMTPEDGVRCYEFDRTQGPACALACAASTVWRNYFMPVTTDNSRGQRHDHQLNNLGDLQVLLDDGLLQVRNGYASPAPSASERVGELVAAERDSLRGAVRVGVQWDAEVTDMRAEYKKNSEGKWATVTTACEPVTQVFCSALALGSLAAPRQWRGLAQLVLEAAYEATLAVATLNMRQGGSRDVYLTLLGGGNFLNGPKWIQQAMYRALDIYRDSGLCVKIVHFTDRAPWMPAYRQLVAAFGAEPGALPDFEDEAEEG